MTLFLVGLLVGLALGIFWNRGVYRAGYKTGQLILMMKLIAKWGTGNLKKKGSGK